MLKISNLLILSLILNVISCSTKKIDENICPKYSVDTKVYQCHNILAKNFSFLSKYKNLEALDLTGTSVNDLSFLRKLQKIKTLILIGTKVEKFSDIIKLKELEQVFLNNTPLEKFDNIFYFNKYKNINFNKLLVNNRNLLFSLFAFESVDKINFFDYTLEDISGITQLKLIKELKLHLKSDKYINYIEKLMELRILHLSGNIKKLPDLNKLKKLEELYLYNTKIKDYSFLKLKESSINYLYIVTKKSDNKKWIELEKKYPNIEIEIKNILYLPTRDYVHTHRIPYTSLGIKNNITFFKKNAYWSGYGIGSLRKNYLRYSYRLGDIKFLLEELNININHLWKSNREDDYANITFLDKAIKDNNKEVIDYLKSLGAKRGCEVLKKECE